MRRVAPLFVLVACTSEVKIAPPERDPRAESELMIVALESEARYVLIGDDPSLLSAPADAVVHWVELASTPETLGVAPGVLTIAADASRFVPSPRPEVLSIWIGSLGVGGWERDPGYAPPLERLFGRDCGEATDHAPPHPPACPGWMIVEGADCRFPARPACPTEMVRFGLTADCEAYAAACPPDRWARDLPPGAVHVDARVAAGGDGSIDLPFRSLSEALASGTTTIALAAGAYSANVPISGAIFGHCADDTTLSLGAKPISGTLEGVTVTDAAVLAGVDVRAVIFGGGVRAGPGLTQLTETVFRRDLGVEGATVTVDRVVFERRGSLSCKRGAVYGQRLTVGAINGGPCPIDLERFDSSGAIATSSGAVTLRDGYLRGPVVVPAPLAVTDVWVDAAEVSSRGIIDSYFPTTLTDVAIVASIYAIEKTGSRLSLDRVFSAAPGAMDLIDSELTARDLTADTTPGDYSVVSVMGLQNVVADVERARVLGRGQPGISVRDSHATFRDLDLRAFSFGIFSSGTSFGMANPGEQVRLERFTIEDCGTAVVLSPAGTLDGFDGAFRRNGRWLEACSNPRGFTRVEVDQCTEPTCKP